MDSIVRFVLKDGAKKTSENFENFKVQIQKIDGTIVEVPKDFSYVDVTVPEGNYNLIKAVFRVHQIQNVLTQLRFK